MAEIERVVGDGTVGVDVVFAGSGAGLGEQGEAEEEGEGDEPGHFGWAHQIINQAGAQGFGGRRRAYGSRWLLAQPQSYYCARLQSWSDGTVALCSSLTDMEGRTGAYVRWISPAVALFIVDQVEPASTPLLPRSIDSHSLLV